MKTNRKRTETALTSKEYKIYHRGIDPYAECMCIRYKHFKLYTDKSDYQIRPYHNKAGKCRYGNSHKSWKNYRSVQYKVHFKLL